MNCPYVRRSVVDCWLPGTRRASHSMYVQEVWVEKTKSLPRSSDAARGEIPVGCISAETASKYCLEECVPRAVFKETQRRLCAFLCCPVGPEEECKQGHSHLNTPSYINGVPVRISVGTVVGSSYKRSRRGQSHPRCRESCQKRPHSRIQTLHKYEVRYLGARNPLCRDMKKAATQTKGAFPPGVLPLQNVV